MKIKNTTVESTPFASVEITDKAKGGKVVAWFRLYWSERSGTYGHQVCFQGNDFRKEESYFEGKTSGCGFSKECAALEECINHITGDIFSCGWEASSLFHANHKGGNFYKMSLGQLKKAIKK